MLSIIIPTYKEVENLRLIASMIHFELSPRQISYEILFVDDDSNDGTENTCADLSLSLPVRLISRRYQKGLSSAVITGFHHAKGDFLIVMDADLSHPPSAIPLMINLLKTGQTDYVVGSRYINGGSIDTSWSFFRYLNSKVATLLAKPLTQIKDPMSGFFALRKKDLPLNSALSPIGYKISLELIVKGKFNNVKEIAIHFSERQFGRSKMNFKEQCLYLRHIFSLYRYRLRQVIPFYK